MGIVRSSLINLGSECSGIIRAIGPEAKGLLVGDRVAAMANGSFSSCVIVSEKSCVKLPDDLSFENAATMPVVFTTVIYSLLDLGKLDNDSVCP